MKRHAAFLPALMLLFAARPGATDVWDSAVPALSRRALDGTILTNGQPATSEFGGLFGAYSLGLTWQNTSATASSDHVVVAGAGCGSTCTNGARYTLRLYETTTAVPRFNNSGSQISVLMVQNTSSYHAVTGTAWFWRPDGALLASQGFNVSVHGLYVVNTSGLPGLAGQAGSITITHDGRYGDLGGKAIAVEPATGFSFDSPMTSRAN